MKKRRDCPLLSFRSKDSPLAYTRGVTRPRVRQLMGLLLAVFALTAAACDGKSAATKPTANLDVDATTIATQLLPEASSAFDAMLEGKDASDVRGALREAERLAGFNLRLPTRLPASAQGPDLVRVSPITGDGKSFRVELSYTGGSTFEYENRVLQSSLELFLMAVRADEAQGESWRDDMAGYSIYRLVNGVDSNGLPVQTVYTARKTGETVIMIFTGEQPTEESLEAMLASFVPLAEWEP